MFDAPGLVKLVLEDNGGISKAFVAPSDDASMVEAVLQENVECLWTPKSQYMQRRSKYNK